jgi:hypothetical protein
MPLALGCRLPDHTRPAKCLTGRVMLKRVALKANGCLSLSPVVAGLGCAFGGASTRPHRGMTVIQWRLGLVEHWP